MKKSLLLLSIFLLIGGIFFQSCKREGCTNSRAENYDSKAKTDDGTCIVKGCTDITATNYDSEATQEDGSCVYPKGELIFYTDADYGVGIIEVTVEEVSAGTITKYYSSGEPECGSEGCVTVEKKSGSYSYSAEAADGTTWSGNIEIKSGECRSLRLYVSNETGQGIFWTDADYGVGKISVYVEETYEGQITGFYSTGTPDCGSEYCVTIERSPGTYSFRAVSDNETEWNSSITITSGGCKTMRLYVNTKNGKGMFSNGKTKENLLRKISKQPSDGLLKPF